MAKVASSRSPLFDHSESFMAPSSDDAADRSIASPGLSRRGNVQDQQHFHRTADGSKSRPYDSSSVPQDVAPSSDFGPDATLAVDDDFPEPICGGCKKLIDEDSADAGVIHFATQLWHVDCFRCAKCQNLVTTDCDDILLLSDGNPICGQCNYSCQICGLPIMEEAIMTGDESYHAACFTCRSCHSPIAELVFAKTSQGIYCMKCHNQRVARSRRHAERKKGAAKTKRSDLDRAALTDASAGEGRSPSTSNSVEASPIVASESDATSTRTLESNLTQPSSSSSLNPQQSVRGGASTPTGNTSLHSPSASHHKLEGSPSSLHRTPLDSCVMDRTAPVRSHSSMYGGVAAATKSPTLKSATTEPDYPSRGNLTQRDGGQLTAGNGLGIETPLENKPSVDLQQSPRVDSGKKLEPPTIVQPSSGSDAEAEGGRRATPVQYKRASRLQINTPDSSRLSRTFSMYDPEIVSLMESISRFESSDDMSLDLPAAKGQPSLQEDDNEDGSIPEHEADGEDGRSSPATLKKHDSTHSLHQISNKMRQSIKSARNGHVSMDTKFVESILTDLDATRERMKTLQSKYDRMRRASQQAVLGFSSAREEYEQEAQARYDAETEMLSLKRQLHIQATKLTELTTEKKQQESLQRRSTQVKTSLQGLERDLAKLTVERDLTVAEVAELVAMQDGRDIVIESNEETVKRSLTKRLEGVKDRYRGELRELRAERDALLADVEDLRQTRDTFAEEMHMLSTRNEELTASLHLLTKRLETVKAGANVDGHTKQSQAQPPRPAAKSSASMSTASFGFGFGRQARGSSNQVESSSVGHAKVGSQPLDPIENQSAVSSLLRAEAMPKKFKWKKTAKLSTDAGRSLGLPPASPTNAGPSPPVPPKSGNQQTSPFSQHGTTPSLQQQQQLQPLMPLHSTGSAATQQQQQQQHQSADQALAPNGFINGEVVVKEHLFVPYSILRPTRCFACQKNMWGQSETKCSLCNQACHIRCLQSLPTSCNQPFTRSDEAANEYTGPSMFGRALIDQVQSEGSERKTPLVVEKCIQAVEHMGMDYEGIYRKSGGTSQLKIITQLFENRQPFNLEDRDRFNDISAITSVLKNYFRELPEPLLTYELYAKFVKCAESKSESSKKLAEMRDLVKALPQEHFDTLSLLISHLSNIKAKAEENRMNSRNLGVVFGPTLMRSADPSQEFAHMGGKAMTIEFMIDNPSIFD